MKRIHRSVRSAQNVAVLLAVALSLAAGCKLDACRKLAEKFGGKKAKTLRATDDKSTIKVPGRWDSVKYLNDEATIQAVYSSRASFVIVLTESRDNFKEYTLQKYSDLVRGLMKKKMERVRELGPTALKIGGLPAIQYELHTVMFGNRQRMIHTVVQGETHYHQILVWTTPKYWERQKKTFHKIVRSFRALAGPGKPRPRPRAAAPVKPLRAKDGMSRVRVPMSWIAVSDLNKIATIQARSGTNDRFLLVITEAKAALGKAALQGYADIIRKSMQSKLQDYQETGPKKVQIGGLPGLQYVIRCSVGGIRVVYLATFLESKTNYHQVLLWTVKTMWPSAKGVLHQIAATG